MHVVDHEERQDEKIEALKQKVAELETMVLALAELLEAQLAHIHMSGKNHHERIERLEQRNNNTNNRLNSLEREVFGYTKTGTTEDS